MARKSKPTMPLYVRLDPKLHDLLVGHMKRSGLSRAAIVEGALWRLFLDVDKVTAEKLIGDEISEQARQLSESAK